MSQAASYGGVIGKLYFGKVGKEATQRGPGLEKSEAVLAVADRGDSTGLGQPGGEKLGWRTERNPMSR